MNKTDREPVSPELRQWCFHRAGGHCFYCGVVVGWGLDTAVIDHQLPRSRGGASNRENCVLSCFACNHDKSTSNLEQYRDIMKTRLERSRERIARAVRGTAHRGIVDDLSFKDFRFFGER